uniref:Uncharacterized protein n=1 Tax=Cannabis sativa TaxID=3483 RepID=A0A803QCU0_CANSA
MYSMSSFLLPKIVCDDLDKEMRRFWWVGNETKERFLALVNVDSLCKPWDRGELGFRRSFDFNMALLSKLGWLLASGKETLWTKVFRGRYMFNRSFWDVVLPRNCSFVDKEIFASREFLRNNWGILIRNGASIDAWHAP